MTDTTTEPASTAPHSGLRWRRTSIAVVLLVAALAASLLFAPPAFFFTSLLKKAVHDATGRELSVAIAKYRIRETVTVELSGVELGRPGSAPGSSPFTSRTVVAQVTLRSILSGEPHVLSLDLDAPVLNLVRAADGSGNWQIAAAPSQEVTIQFALPPTKVRNGTLLYTDDGSNSQLRLDAITANIAADPRYGGAAAKGTLAYNNEPLQFDLAVSDAAAALGGRATPLALSIDSRILKAKLVGEGAIGDTPMLSGEIDASSPSTHDLASWLGFGDNFPSTAGAISLEAFTDAQTKTRTSGSIVLRDAPMTYDLTLANLREALAGKPSALKGALRGAGLDAQIDGSLTIGPDVVYAGSVSARTDTIGDLATHLGATNPAIKALGPGSLTGRIDARTNKIALSETTFDADGRTGSFTGNIVKGPVRPRISGKLELSRIDLDALLGRTPLPPQSIEATSVDAGAGFETTFDVLSAELQAFETAPARQSPASLEATAAPTSAWSTAPIDLKALRAIDLDLDLTVPEVKFGQLPLTNARVKANLDNGELAATLDRVQIGTGGGSGTISLKARGSSHEAALALKLQNVDAEPITAELSGKPLLKGTSTVDVTTRARGRSPAELVATLDGSARIDMTKGQLRGWDIGQMVAQLWNYKGWGYTPARNTPVDRLTATYTIRSGTITSAPDLTMTGPTAGLRSVGNVIVPRRLIDQTIDVQNLLFNIVIKGDWTKKLWIGPAFLAGIKPAPGAAMEASAETAAAFPDAIPSDLAARIDRILSDSAASARLSSEQKAFLKGLAARGRSGT